MKKNQYLLTAIGPLIRWASMHAPITFMVLPMNPLLLSPINLKSYNYYNYWHSYKVVGILNILKINERNQ